MRIFYYLGGLIMNFRLVTQVPQYHIRSANSYYTPLQALGTISSNSLFVPLHFFSSKSKNTQEYNFFFQNLKQQDVNNSR